MIAASRWRMGVLRLVSDLHLPDSWVGAGFVRNAVWDHLHGRSMTPLNDIDVIYFDREHCAESADDDIVMDLRSRSPKKPWSVTNQARMHQPNGHQPYSSSVDALRHWPETATAVAVRLLPTNKLDIAAPYGVDDLLDLIVRPTSAEKRTLVEERAAKKRWYKIWPKLRYEP